MSTLITYDKTGGKLSVKITISSYLPWSYEYLEENHNIKFKANSEDSGENISQTYELGSSDEMQFDHNFWCIYFINVQKGLQYKAKIEWLQEGNNEPLHVYEVEKKSGNIEDMALIEVPGAVRFYGALNEK